MKKKFLFPFSLILALIVYFGVRYSNLDNKDENFQSFNTFFKNNKGSIQTYSSTAEELRKSQIAPVKKERNPSSIKNSEVFKHLPMFKDRVIIGTTNENLSLESLTYINHINPEWKKLLGEDLLRFQSNETKVILKEEFSMIKIEDNKARYVEQVIINYVLKNGETSSFKALVDSESGLVLETWDRTIHESPLSKFKKRGIKIDN